MTDQDEHYTHAQTLVEHCRYCDRMDDPRSRCRSDHEHNLEDVAVVLREGAKREADLRREVEQLRAVFASISPKSNSRAYSGLLATGQTLIDKDAEIAMLKAKCNQKDDEYEQRVEFADGRIAALKAEIAALKIKLNKLKGTSTHD